MLREISRRKFTVGLMATGGMLLTSRRACAAEFRTVGSNNAVEAFAGIIA